jgi:hypothetical protein
MSDEVRGDDVKQPSTRIEQTVARIWEETQGIHGIADTSDFFVLGGHSLLAVPVMAQIHEETGGQALSALSLIESPVVTELARAVEAR